MTSGRMREHYPEPGEDFVYRIVEGKDSVEIEIEGETVEIEVIGSERSEGWFRWRGRVVLYAISWVGEELHLWLDGALYVFAMEQRRSSSGRRAASSLDSVTPGGSLPLPREGHIVAPMVGRVVEVKVG